MTLTLNTVDKLEILTLQDNYIDLMAGGNTDIVRRAAGIKAGEVANSLLAEHGFSAVITATSGSQAHSLLFDFGYSAHGAAYNAKALGADLTRIEALALSHGHPDHTGGLKQLAELMGRKPVEFIAHPAAFKYPRYLKITEEVKIAFPRFDREDVKSLGLRIRETREPYLMLDGAILFLGEIPRVTSFEKGMPMAYYRDEHGEEKWDPIEDDTGVAAHVKGKGLVIVSGCAHAGIINTVKQAVKVTGIEQILAVIGGFHLTGRAFADLIKPTTDALKEFKPAYVVPTHCTGREAINYMEKELPDSFILNMAGTNLTFSA